MKDKIMSKLEQPKQQKRISPELAEVLHMLRALEAQAAQASATTR
jgi:beta-galactosidase beta subunit